jgi:hypothetical protein
MAVSGRLRLLLYRGGKKLNLLRLVVISATYRKRTRESAEVRFGKAVSPCARLSSGWCNAKLASRLLSGAASESFPLSSRRRPHSTIPPATTGPPLSLRSWLEGQTKTSYFAVDDKDVGIIGIVNLFGEQQRSRGGVGQERNCGYHPRNTPSRSPSNTLVRVWVVVSK